MEMMNHDEEIAIIRETVFELCSGERGRRLDAELDVETHGPRWLAVLLDEIDSLRLKAQVVAASRLAPSVDAVDPHAASTGTLSTRV